MIVRWRIQRAPRRWGEARVDWTGGRRAPVDLYATEEAYILTAVLLGVRPEDLDIEVEEQTLTLTARAQQPGDGRQYLMRELPSFHLRRRVRLPEPVNAAKAKATLEKGVLTVHLPKADRVLPRRIKVKAK